MSKVTDAVLDGRLDGQLTELQRAIKLRKTQLLQRKLLSLRPGGTVTFSESARPKYLIGLTATVIRTNRSSVTVRMPNDPKYGKFANSQGTRCPLSILEL